VCAAGREIGIPFLLSRLIDTVIILVDIMRNGRTFSSGGSPYRYRRSEARMAEKKRSGK